MRWPHSSRSCSSASTSSAGVGQFDMFRRATVADFPARQGPAVRAAQLFATPSIALYEKVYSHLKPQTPTPDLVIYLQAPGRHARRARAPARRRLRAQDSGGLPGAPRRRRTVAISTDTTRAPLLIVNSERLNFVDNREHVSLLLARIAAMRGPREFFNLAS
jgi:hypothetical protein